MAKNSCPVCEGTGWKPLEADGVRRVARCACRQGDRAELLLKQARIPPRYEHCALENFDVRDDDPSLRVAKLHAETFVKEYPIEDGLGLLFVGPTGVGKTHLAVAILRELIIRRGIECLFYGFRDLLKEIQDSWNPVSQTSELRVLQPVLETEVLLLDELAASNPSDWVKETLSHIINSRYNQKRVTLITTTILPERSSGRGDVKAPSGEPIDFERCLEQLGVTMRSRLYEMCKLVVIRPKDDFRKAVKQATYKFHADK